jgi:hypothetical protein
VQPEFSPNPAPKPPGWQQSLDSGLEDLRKGKGVAGGGDRKIHCCRFLLTVSSIDVDLIKPT